MTVPAPIKGRRVLAAKCSIQVADIQRIKLQQKPWNSALTITTSHGAKKHKLQFCTTTPEKWRHIALLIQHIPLLDSIRGSRGAKEWKIKRAAEEATCRARERLRFPRIAVKRDREQPSSTPPRDTTLVSQPESKQGTPRTPRTMNKNTKPATPKSTPRKKLKYNDDPPYSPAGPGSQNNAGNLQPKEEDDQIVVVTWNARSLAQEETTTAPKLNGLVDILRTVDPDVLCLQETWMKGEKWGEIGNVIESMGWYVTYSQHGGPGCGMATLTRKARGPRPVITKRTNGGRNYR